MARKKKKRGLRNFGSLNISLNFPFSFSGQGNRFGAKLFDKNPELKEYLTKESFEKLYDSEFSEFVPPTSQPETKDPYQEALDFLNGQASTDQIKAFLQTTLGKTNYGEITNFENPENSVGDNYVYSFGDGTPLFNPEFISSIQSQLDTLGIDLDDLQALLDAANADNEGLGASNAALTAENDQLIVDKAALEGQVAELQAQLAQEPQFANTGLPTINLAGSNGDADPDTGIARQVILNADMANVTSRTLTIYKITPGNNAGVGLNDSTIAQSSTGALIKDLDMGIGTGGARIGNTGSNRLVTIIFESESVYVFEVTGKNDGGVEDNENPKTLTKSAIFTTVDSDDSFITNLQSQLSGSQAELEAEIIAGIGLQNQINTLNSNIQELTAERNQFENSSNNARGALDVFSDAILLQIEGLKNSLTQEAVTDGTISSMNTLISSFNAYVTQINNNTPANTPVTQISSFEATNIEGGGGQESEGLFPTNYPDWLGGDNISIQDNDNILFDLDLNISETPQFTIPQFFYDDDILNMPRAFDNIPDEAVENKFLTILRFTALRATQSSIKNNSGKSGFIIGRGNSFTSSHSQTPHTYLNGNINNVIDGWNQTNQISGLERTPSLLVQISGQDSYNLGNSGINTSLTNRINENDRKGIGNKNIVSLANPNFYSSDDAQSLIYLNANDSFRFTINPESLPYIDDNNVNQSFVLGLTFHFIIKNYDSYEMRTRRCTGVFNFNGGALMGV